VLRFMNESVTAHTIRAVSDAESALALEIIFESCERQARFESKPSQAESPRIVVEEIDTHARRVLVC
jgi:hypothetical protein